MNICFLTKKEKPYVQDSIEYVSKIAEKLDVYDSTISNVFPPKIIENNYDIIISYISSWIIPKPVLEKTKRWNINFHPGPPDYPGTGCFNFAIYDSATNYGATAHIMDSSVDTGKIINVKRFPITEKETVETLSLKTYNALSKMLENIIDFIIDNDSLPKTEEVWERKPFKRSELEALATIDISMSKQEIEKRIRATYYPGKPAPFIKINGNKFEFNPKR